MRRFAYVCLTVVLAGCGGSADQANPPADSAAMAPPAPAGISLADVAGNWNVQVMPENSDSVVLTYQLTATGETSGWSIKFSDRPNPIPLHVVGVAGDSIMIHADPFPSALRKGQTVETSSVVRLQNGQLVGRSTAHYKPAGADSVAVMRTVGTRAQ